jgi:class 3 adenylate cyclase
MDFPLNPNPTRAIAGERRVVTILFCDVKGSTAFAEHLDPEEWAEIMNAAFSYLIEPVQRYGGTVARLMGDAILAFFGAPAAHEDDPQRAVLAGLEIVSSIQEYRKQLEQEYGLDFNVRVGINTGSVVVGEVGTALAGEYTAMGDAVNLAARMEQTAQPGTVQITGETYRQVGTYFDVESLGEMEVKGKSEAVAVYRVLGQSEQPGRGRSLPGLSSPLVGREKELQALLQALEGLSQGRSQIITLIGDVGLGKTRLLEEARARLAASPDGSIRWVESRGMSFETTRPYGLFAQHLRQVCGLRDDDTKEELYARVASAFPGLEIESQALIVRMVELLLSLRSGSQEESVPVQGETIKREIFEASLALWRALAQQVPLTLVFDDLHWADPASIELLLHLFQLTDETPIVFLCAFRPYRTSSAWTVKTAAEKGFPHRYQEISLAPLSGDESDRLIENLLAAPELPSSLRQTLLRKAEGNPLFLEEVVRALIENGLLQHDTASGEFSVGNNLDDFTIPDSLQALLLARIDRLETGTRHTLQLASVIGRSFFYRVLQAITEQASALDQQLIDLQRVELIKEISRQPEVEYIFRHELTRDAAYQSILRRQRRQFHRRVAETIEALFPDRLEEEAYRLAYHYRQAGDSGRALEYYITAGDHAARLYANKEACEHYHAGLELGGAGQVSQAQLIHLYSRLGRTLELIAEDEEALALYKELETIGREQEKPELVLAGLLPQATLHSTFTVMMDAGRGRDLSLEALGMARELGDARSEVKALWNLVLIENYTSAEVGLAVTYGEEAVTIARTHALWEELAYVQHDLARTYYRLARVDDAWRVGMEAQNYWRETGNKPMLADNLGLMAEANYLMAQFEAGLALAGEGLRISQATGNLWGQAYSQYILAPIYLEFGEVDQGLALLDGSQRLAEQAQFTAPLLFLQMIRAWVYADLGDRESAVIMLDNLRMPDISMSLFDKFNEVRLFYRCYFAGQDEKAKALLNEIGEAIMSGTLELYYGPLIYAVVTDVLLACGDFAQALSLAETYLIRLRSNQVYLCVPDLLHDKGRALLGLGRHEEAYAAFLEAYREAHTQNSRRNLYPILADLADLEPDPGKAAAYRQEGLEVTAFIAGTISEPGLKAAFLNLPAVQNLTN